MQWSPSASLATLWLGDKLRRAIREWMGSQGILEVCTPPLSLAANTDPSVEPLYLESTVNSAKVSKPKRYLHTSPEFAMKRILAAFPETDIYQIATVFRAEEQGRFHSTQFSLLEWYRVGMDHHALMLDVQGMMKQVYTSLGLDYPGVTYYSYCDAVRERMGVWPQELEPKQVQGYFDSQVRSFPRGMDQDLNACLDLFMDEFVLPDLPGDRLTLLTDYPASQAALAQVGFNKHGLKVAERFELYFGTVELANGFHELTNADEQRRRFEQDLNRRKAQNLDVLPIDENLLASLDYGLPACAGVAVGLDRLLMVLGKHEHIADVLCFDDSRA